jgi:ABC-type lipoprotein export system ATPase subunit
MISVRHASKHYGPPESGVHALRDVSLEIPAGQFLAIMGPSGCGKSTLLHVLGGLDRLTSGEVFIDHQPLHTLNDIGLTQLRRTHVGFIFQFFNLLPTLTVLENVELPGLLQGRKQSQVKERAQDLLQEVGLAPRLHHQLHQLSGGEMQRAALARALLLEPKVILADEPTGNLDSETSLNVIRLFKNLGHSHHTTIVPFS